MPKPKPTDPLDLGAAPEAAPESEVPSAPTGEPQAAELVIPDDPAAPRLDPAAEPSDLATASETAEGRAARLRRRKQALEAARRLVRLALAGLVAAEHDDLKAVEAANIHLLQSTDELDKLLE